MPLRRSGWLLPLLLLVAGRMAPEVAADEPPAPPAAPPGAPTLEERDVRIPMRDGAVLAANVARPRAPGRYPAIVVQTPYDKNRLGREVGDLPGAGEAGRGSLKAWARMDREHYAYVIVDWRGFFGSRAAGAGRRPGQRGEDGFDVVEWVATQPWCDGRVGTWGGSALGKAQLDTAAEQPPHLVCAVPLIAFMGTSYESFFEGGVRLEAHTRALDALGFGVGGFVDQNPLPGAPAWRLARRFTYRPERIAVPCLFISGWWDHYPREVIETFEDVRARGGPEARAHSRLVLGPWSHTAVDVAEQGDLAFPAAEGYSTTLTLRFFDRFLRGVTDGWDAVPRVHVFQTREERWVTGERPADLWGTPTAFALRPDGRLTHEPPTEAAAAAARTYRYDPRTPLPTIGGRNMLPLTHGPKDITALGARTDLVAFATAPLAEPLALRGAAELTLTVACDRPDVDLVLLLGDTFPDGRTYLVGEAIQRASLRGGREAQPLRPGEAVPVTLRLPPHAWTFDPGHRLACWITSGSWPRYERNPHSGALRWDASSARDVTVSLRLGPGETTLRLPLVAR